MQIDLGPTGTNPYPHYTEVFWKVWLMARLRAILKLRNFIDLV